MAYRASVVPVMIASPSDVVQQRDDIRNVINTWNVVNGYARKTILTAVGWETHSAPDLSGRPQSIINERLLKDCDLLVGVFWTRLGTETGEFESGTVEEISRHIDAGKPAMVYFSDAPVIPQSIDLEQLKKVGEFKKWCYGKGIVESFGNAEEFREKFDRHLHLQLNSNSYLSKLIRNIQDIDEVDNVDELSVEGRELLIEGALSPDGYVMCTRSMGGLHVQTNGKTFGIAGDPRSEASWEAAVEELSQLAYLSSRGSKGEIFQISKTGYARADTLRETNHE